MPFTHKILAYNSETKEIKDSELREESAKQAWVRAREYADDLNKQDPDVQWRATVLVDVVAKSE